MLAPAAIVPVESPLRLNPAPLTDALAMVNDELPVFFSWIDCVFDVPTGTFPKLAPVGVIVKVPEAAAGRTANAHVIANRTVVANTADRTWMTRG
jgi:hypothetical protein